ncbi:MAG: hypothetical protein LQ340_002315 [Diploschistes diacapsis]|nr:MAG: hypothetical protein LQ340_002315 [Diploschistes diacapsis]
MKTQLVLKRVLLLQILGSLSAAGAGAVRPLMTLVFGGLANQFNGLQDFDSWKRRINQEVLFLIYLFIGQWVLVFSYGIFFSISAMQSSIRFRAASFRSAISRNNGQAQGNAATNFSTNTENIEDALAEKLGLVIEALSTIVISWVVALTRSWRLTLVLSAVTTILLGSNFGTAAIDADMEERIQAIDGRAATLAEECFMGIMAVITTSSQHKFQRKFQRILQEAKFLRFRKSPIPAA